MNLKLFILLFFIFHIVIAQNCDIPESQKILLAKLEQKYGVNTSATPETVINQSDSITTKGSTDNFIYEKLDFAQPLNAQHSRPAFPQKPISPPETHDPNLQFSRYPTENENLNLQPQKPFYPQYQTSTTTPTCQNVPTYFDYFQWVERIQNSFDQQYEKLNQISILLKNQQKPSQKTEITLLDQIEINNTLEITIEKIINILKSNNYINFSAAFNENSEIRQVLIDLIEDGGKSGTNCNQENEMKNHETCKMSPDMRIFKTKTREIGKYIGCFAEDEKNPILNGFVTKTKKNSKDFCVALCQKGGFIYAGTGFGEWCMCGNTYPRVEIHYDLAKTECNSPCSGNPMEMCGGPMKMSLFETGIELYVRGVVGVEIQQSYLPPSAHRFYGYREVNSDVYDS